MKDIKEMTDEELDKAIEEKYGEDWTPEKLDEGDSLVKEWIHRLTTCCFASDEGAK